MTKDISESRKLSGNPAIDYINLVQGSIMQDDAYNVGVMSMRIKEYFVPCKDYNAAKYVDFPTVTVDYQAYVSPDQSMGCLIVDADNATRVIAIADFQKESQFVIEVNPDGFGDRVTYQPLRDRKLLGLKDHFPLTP